MKRIFLLFILAACGGGTTTGDDAGNNDAGTGKDATQSQDAVADTSPPSDSSTNDVVQNNDGGLNVGDGCDPQNNQCKAGLLCCSEPTHNGPDAAASAYICEKPVNKSCPLLP
jgi:hypothetical protein